jgi:hypothetical protein
MRERMNRFQKMLIACSGAVEDVLERSECRADAKKYAMIGAFVLLTAIFASFSSTFALYTGIGSLPLAIILGIAWGLMIFTLDRFVVSGIRKSDVEGLPHKKQVAKRVMEWLIALPRIALAALISVVVATPLELRFFEREINTQLEQNQTLARRTAGENLDREFDEAATLRTKNDELRESIDDAWKKHDTAYTLAVQESVGKAGFTTMAGEGPVFGRLKAQADHLERLAQQTEKTNSEAITFNSKRIAQLDEERQRRLAHVETTIDTGGGFLARYGALGQMAKANPDIRMARAFLMLLFLAVELTPVLMKLLLRRGPYDDFIDTLEHRVHVTALLERSHMNDDAHAEVALHSSKNNERMQLEETLRRSAFGIETVGRLAATELEEAQTKLARASIQAWLRKEMAAFGPKPHVPVRKPPRGSAPGSQPIPASQPNPVPEPAAPVA